MNKKTIMISQTTFLLSSEFLLVNFREEIDEDDGQHVGDQDRYHRVKEGNRSGGLLYHGLGFYGSRLARRVASGELLTRLIGAELTCLSNFCPAIDFIPRDVS